MDVRKVRMGVKWGKHELDKIHLYCSPQTKVTVFLADYKLGLDAWLRQDISPLDNTAWVTVKSSSRRLKLRS